MLEYEATGMSQREKEIIFELSNHFIFLPHYKEAWHYSVIGAVPFTCPGQHPTQGQQSSSAV